MAATRKVYVYSIIPRLAEVLREKLTDVTVIEVKGPVGGKYENQVYEEEVAVLQDAEVLLVDNHLLAQIADKLPTVKWVQGSWAGVESLVKNFSDKPKPAFPVSRMVNDNFSQLMAEYVIGWIVTHERGFLDCRHNQFKSEWQQENNISCYRGLRELTVGVLGMGHIGKEVARSLKAFHCTVHAFSRTLPSAGQKSENIDKYWHTGELPQFLEQCDFIVNVMPSTPATRGMLGADILKHAKKGAVFINIGRGDVISEEDLLKVLDYEWISAAILDVFEEEPLPRESALWKHPKVMVTPHVAGMSRSVDVAEAFVHNYQRFISGQQVDYIIDWNVGY